MIARMTQILLLRRGCGPLLMVVVARVGLVSVMLLELSNARFERSIGCGGGGGVRTRAALRFAITIAIVIVAAVAAMVVVCTIMIITIAARRRGGLV